MDITTYRNNIVAIQTKLNERGYKEFWVSNMIDFAGALVALKVKFVSPNKIKDITYESGWFKADTEDEIETAFANLNEFIDNTPTPEESRKDDFVRNLAFLIEESRELDLPAEIDMDLSNIHGRLLECTA